jgi:N-acetylmuramoyl-L-alanine amidase
VKQAPFYVLIGARMPSILIEMGFITNPTEHKRLSSSRYRDQVAEGIARGVLAYSKSLKKK